MHNIIIEKPYTFFPPFHYEWAAKIISLFTPLRLRRKFGITQVVCQGEEKLRALVNDGHGVLIAPNHSHPADPFVVTELCRRVSLAPYIMASWHLFMQTRWQALLLQTSGVFSIYREGVDRVAIAEAVDILSKRNRPLVIFPEGVISRHNEQLNPLQAGVAFMARAAAKRLAKEESRRKIYIVPMALKFFFRGNFETEAAAALSDIEQRLSWRTHPQLPTAERIVKLGTALLALKEVEFLGAVQAGSIAERLNRLVNHLLQPLEAEWIKGPAESGTVARVKKLRAAVLPEMVEGNITEAERARRWRQLEDMYLAQQLHCYPADYVATRPSVDRMLETIEKFEEDLSDKCRIYRPRTAEAVVGEPIEVTTDEKRDADGDPLSRRVEEQLLSMLQR